MLQLMNTDRPLLSVRDLRIRYDQQEARPAVDGVSFDVGVGEIVGLVGESGSGKSSVALAVTRLLPADATVDGEILFRSDSILRARTRALRSIRGAQIGLVVQDPVSALNPVLKVGSLLTAAVRSHAPLGKREASALAGEMIRSVGLGPHVLERYPRELSGGMCQRVCIALALISGASLLIADEPTTALDVTVQARVMDVIKKLRDERGLSCLLISHDLALLGQVCDRLVVLYHGEVVETGRTEVVLQRPRHPYTAALLACAAEETSTGSRFVEAPPSVRPDGSGCAFFSRCPHAVSRCGARPVPLEMVDDGHSVRCIRAGELGPTVSAGSVRREDGT